MRVLRLVFDDDLSGAEAAFLDLLHYKPAAWQTKRVDTGLQCGKLDARIDKRAEHHVAADSTGTVEVSDPHGSGASVRERGKE